MTSAILVTKLHAPRPRAGVVDRPRLTERLDLGGRSKLTLVSAPPGFGKSTVVGSWIAARPTGSVTAWLSLDPGDNEPAAFWTYVVSALQQALPGAGGDALTQLSSGQAQTEAVVRSLLNELAAQPDDIVLVLDDFHAIDRPDVLDGVGSLLDRAPPTLHLVITTRADPALPLARLRARGELVEIRAADLRFTPGEAAAYLNGTMGLALTGDDVAALEGRTEGWIAALQLAALSIQGRDDVASFIDSFAGDDRYVVDYLVDEVLARQTDEVRDFLVQTALLDRINAPLAEAVTERRDGQAMLAALDRANLFLVPLDDRRRWYRYHHLFADVLRARLLDERPDDAPAIHRRASAWFEENDEPVGAIEHALAGRDFERAAALVEAATSELQKARREGLLRRWFEAIPRDLYADRPVLAIGHVGAHMATGDLAGVESLLDDAARWVDEPGAGGRGQPASSAEPVVVDDAMFGRLPGLIALYRAGLARIRGDLAATIEHANRALELTAPDDPFGRGAPAALMGLTHFATGDLESAHRWYAEGMAYLERAGHLPDVVGGAITLADIRIAQGRLHDAKAAYERGLAMATQPGRPLLRGAADMHAGLAEIALERDDLAAARSHMAASRQLGDENGMPQYGHRWRVAEGRILRAEGDLDAAIGLFDEAERRYVEAYSPNSRPIAALRTRAWIARGDLDQAWAWVRQAGITAGDELTFLRAFEHATLARLLAAQGRRDADEASLAAAGDLATRLVVAADAAGRQGDVLDSLVVEAIVRHARGDVGGAVAALRRAIALAEPEGHVRVFIDEGAAMAGLLQDASKQRDAPAYLGRLRAGAARGVRGPARRQPLVEPLSERELEVLRLLEGDLDGADMARELVISLNTLRTHTKNIYAKLGVASRRAAVKRAAELDLLSIRPDSRRAP